MWAVYIVRCSDSSLYTGIAKNVEGRIKLHNAGRGAKYTRSRLPVELVYCESVDTRETALRREIEIKRLERSEKLKLIASLADQGSRVSG